MRKFPGPLLRTTAGALAPLSAPAVVARPRRTPVAPSGPAHPPDDVRRSTIIGPGAVPAWRGPAYADALGQDREVFDLRTPLRRGGDQPGFRLVAHPDAARTGALLAAVDARN
ncbi:hypothetical protein [Streptomyces sp. NPDC006193]|uniref:hypothetical protein n=1 Tax=Streptomyces sp. NPDC006193 TaxID=3155717 RepID=UPI0033B330A6